MNTIWENFNLNVNCQCISHQARVCFPVFCALLVAVLANSACASRVMHPVAEAERDRSGKFDGTWVVHRLKAPGVQQVGNERFRCPTEGFDFPARVSDGVLHVRRGARSHRTNIGADGRFRLEMPTGGNYRRSRGANANGSEITLVLQGSLAADERGGLYTAGAARLNNHGCEARVRFESTEPKR